MISKYNLVQISGAVILLFFLKSLFVLFFNYYLFNFNFKLSIFLSNKIYKNYIYSEYLSTIKIKTSDILRNLTTEVSNFISCLNNSIQILRDITISFSIILLIILFLDKYLFIIFLIFLILSILFYSLIKDFLKRKGEQTIKLRSDYLATINDSFKLLKEIIIGNKRDFFVNKFISKLKIAENNNFKSYFIFSSGRVVFELFAVTMLIGLIIYMFNKDYSNSYIISYVSLVGVAAIRVMPLFNSILTNLNKIQYKKYSINVIWDLLNFTNIKLEKDKILPNSINFNNLITINDLDFKIDEKQILNNINLKIKKGEKYLLLVLLVLANYINKHYIRTI